MRTTILLVAMAFCGFVAAAAEAQPLESATPTAPPPAPSVDVRIQSPPEEPELIARPAGSLGAPAPGGPEVRYQSFSDVPAGAPACPSCADAPYPAWHSKFRLTRAWYHHWKPCLQESHWGYCEYFDEPPYGAAVRAGCAAMIQNGFSDQYTLYQFDFHPQDSDQASLLNRRGKRELAEIAQKYRAVPVPVLIERSRLPALDAARRQHVLEQLRQAGVQSPDEFVFVGAAPGYLEGVEAVEVYKRFLSLSRPRGASAAPNRTPPPSAGVPPQ